MIAFIQRMITRLSNFGVEPGDSEEVRVRKAILSVASFLVSMALITVFGPFYFFLQ